MRALHELKINEGGRPIARPAPSDADISAFESHFGVRLPDEYVQLLRYSNGGHPELDSIQPAGRPEAERWSVGHFYYLSPDHTGTRSLWRAVETWRPILGERALVFAADGGGNQFFLDLSKSPAPVAVCVHDESFAVVSLTSSFAQFVDALSTDPDMI